MSLAMSIVERERFLSEVHVGVVSIARDGRGPLTVPIWYDFRSGEVWMITSSDSRKGRWLARTDRISLCAQSESPPYRYVSVEGPFTTRATRDEDLLHMAVRYLGKVQGEQYAAETGRDGTSMVVSMTPESWLTVDYGKR